MLDWFNHFFRTPWLMWLGLLLVSVPIIIHLINRIRFKRIRWAAMEFLLKSQKRNRRRLILEQLLLLALRCFLVLLAGLLVARFVSAGIDKLGQQNTRHLAVLDDTLSMSDRWQEQGKDMNCFDMGKAFVRALAKTALEEDSPQHLRLVLLSDPEHPLFDEQINSTSKRTLDVALDSADLKPTLQHIKPAIAFEKANKYFAEHTEGRKVFHFISDFREKDWNTTGTELNTQMDALGKTANVFLMDCAHPYRGDNQQVVLNHDNVCITDLQPETRIVSNEGQPIEFIVTIKNFSPGERKNVMLTVYVDGVERFEATQPIPNIAVGQSEHRFYLGFTKEGPNHITATLEEEKSGIVADNTRHAVVEVRKRIPVLVVDGGFPDVAGELSDTRFIMTALTSAKGFDVSPKGPDALEKEDLSAFPSIFLLNVPTSKISEKGLKNLEEYARKGGRIAFFLGDRVQGLEYNKMLYNGGAGLFPVPLAAKPTEKLGREEREAQMSNGQSKIYLRKEDHPSVRGLNLPEVRKYLPILMIDQYYPTTPRFQWANNDVEEIATLPSRKELKNFEEPAKELYKKLEAEANEEKNAKYQPGLMRYHDYIRKVLAGGTYVHELSFALDGLLTDRGDPDKKDPKRPNLVEFWDLPEQQELMTNFAQLRDAVKYGDPLVVSRRFGKGYVVACLTSASTRWNEWAGGGFASFMFPVFITDLQKYLTGGNEESNRTIGTPVNFVLDAERYEPRMHRQFRSGLPEEKKEKPKDAKGDGTSQDLGEQKVEPKGKQTNLEFNEAKNAGLYEFILYPRGEANPPPETRVYVYNVDTENESDLRRAARDKLERNPTSAGLDQGRVRLLVGEARLLGGDVGLPEALSEKRADFSVTPWIYLLFIVVLVVEQMLAVHLSFHIRGGISNEAQLPTQVLRSQGVAG